MTPVAETRKPRRVRHDIMLEILETALRGTLKTHIMYKTNLSYLQLVDYLKAMKTEGLIKEESGIWHTTEAGKNVIAACHTCTNLMNEMATIEKRTTRKKATAGRQTQHQKENTT